MLLREALRVRRGDMVAFVGAGGKTSALFCLAHELRAEGWRVLATTTTRLGLAEIQRAPSTLQVTAAFSPLVIREQLNQHGFVFLYTSDDSRRHKMIGLHPDYISHLVDAADSDVLLIEADGARRLPFKAPKEHEPVIPADATLVVPIAGINALGQPLDEEHVYHASRILERYGYPEGAPLLPPWMASVLRDPVLGLRGVPESARVVTLLNKVNADLGHDIRRARRVAQMVLRSDRVEAVALGSVQTADHPIHEVQRRVAAIVLAAGESSRMGQSKPLLRWDNRTVIETIVSRLIPAYLAETLVITGYRGDEVARVLAQQPIQIVPNPRYAQGEMLSSLQTGLRALPENITACLVVMGDQPMIEGRVVQSILAAYAQGQGEIVIPTYRGERGHPVLFGRRFWSELLELSSGAPREVIRRHPDQVAAVEVETDSILRDIDTPEQYRQERRRAGW
ncbi:MAG: putative selenium-dependent hydroxylase accessory protein YqeC [Chloroflexi bacterium]|nr:putative selenium-dependent hydroxylase accessory protein YqeC [Chloroflexota bacterium]